VMFAVWSYLWIVSAICMASLWVGTSIRSAIRCVVFSLMRWSIGRVNVVVFFGSGCRLGQHVVFCEH